MKNDDIEVVVTKTAGAVRHTKLQSNYHHQQPTPSFLWTRIDALPVTQPSLLYGNRKLIFADKQWPLQICLCWVCSACSTSRSRWPGLDGTYNWIHLRIILRMVERHLRTLSPFRIRHPCVDLPLHAILIPSILKSLSLLGRLILLCRAHCCLTSQDIWTTRFHLWGLFNLVYFLQLMFVWC